jgi:CubicO group peptidase (beta-lactamase class C family)
LTLSVALLFVVAPTPLAAQRWTLSDSVQARVDSVFAFVDRDAPGCALGVVLDGRLAYARGYGLANLDWGIPISTSTVFDIGSVSKQFTATAIALLDLDGVLSLDDDVRRWIPELPDYGTPITIRHLLNHTSGVRDYLTLATMAGTDFANVFDEFDGIELIVRQRGLNFPPGSEYLYSNSGYLMLANVVRRATGTSLRAFLEERVFEPLGMAHTSIWDDNTEILAERATGYAPDGEGGWEIDHAWNFQMGGDGQVITSIDDLVTWDANFYDPKVGGRGLLERLHTRGLLTTGDTIAYALGLTVDEYRGVRRVTHGGAWAGFRAMLARYPDQRTSVIVECNRSDANTGRYVAEVADVVLADAFREPATATGTPAAGAPGVTLTDAQLGRWAGLYRHGDRPEYVEFRVHDGALHLERGGGTALTPVDAATFRAAVGSPIRFAEADGRVTVTTAGGMYERVDAATPSEGDLAAVAGTYRSEELDVSWTLEAAEGGLALLAPDGERIPLRPGAANEYFGPATLTVIREGGRVTELRVYAGRVTGLVFEREGA